jgi:hypothetical protein
VRQHLKTAWSSWRENILYLPSLVMTAIEIVILAATIELAQAGSSWAWFSGWVLMIAAYADGASGISRRNKEP